MYIFLKENHKETGIHRFLESLTLFGAKIIFVENIEQTNRYFSEKAIFGGFVPEELISNTSVESKYYVFCSPFGQADLSGPQFYSAEISLLIQLRILMRDGKIQGAITQSKSLASRFDNFVYIPPVKVIPKHLPYVKPEERRNYGFLGNNFRKHKNVPNQLAAISRLKPEEPIVVRQKEPYNGYELLFDCKFKETGHLADDKYYREIASHRLCFQCSWSEAFDYQAFEYCLVGVPTIVGPCIDWMPFQGMYEGRELENVLLVENPDNWEEIWYRAQNLLSDKIRYQEISEEIKSKAIEINDKNFEYLGEVYEHLCAV